MNEALLFGQWLFDNAHKSVWAIHTDKWFYEAQNNYFTTEELYEIWKVIR